MKAIMSAEYKTFIGEIKERIHKAQYDAFKAVNKELITLYWDIGRSIVAKQDKLGWGKAIVETLAKDLQKEFPGIQGFSARNLWNMRTFYLTYKDNEKLQPLVAEISWAKNVIIMESCKDDIRREFYLKITKKFGWTKDVLINQLEAGYLWDRFFALDSVAEWRRTSEITTLLGGREGIFEVVRSALISDCGLMQDT